MSGATFDPADWLARAAALGRRVEVVGPVVYFGPRPRGREAEDDRLFAELRAAGGVAALRPYLIRRASRLARAAA